MNQDLGFHLRQDERGDWLYCEEGEERAATLPERVLWKALAAQGVPLLTTVHYAAACEVTQAQRDALPTELYKMGDAVLVWANEGDLCLVGKRINTTPAPAQAQQAEAVALPPIARRRVFDAIAGAYDLGYADRKAGRIGAAKEVEIDHGGALIAALERALAATKAEAKPLTDEQIIGLLYPIYDGLPSLTPITDTKVARATEAACAEKWGVKLAGIGASSGGAA